MTLTLTTILSLAGAMFALSAVPGAIDLAVVARSVSAGWRQGFCMLAGIIAGDWVFILVVVFGMGLVATGMGPLFTVIALIGAVYLIGLGIRTWRLDPSQLTLSLPKQMDGSLSFASGFLITLGDPLPILFYMGFLPAFLDLSTLTGADALVIMLLAAAAISVVKGTYVFLGSRAIRLFNNPTIRRRLNRMAATILIGAGLLLIARCLWP